MHKTLFELGPLTVHTYGFMLALSFAIGIWLAGRRAEKRGIPAERITDVSLIIIVVTILGARGLYVAAHWDQFAGRPLDMFRTWEGGLTMYGGAVPAVVIGMWFFRRWGVNAWSAADAMAPSMALGLALTRVGCFSSGCCFGRPTSLPWGVVFPPESYAGSVHPGVALHPAQLYASGVGLFLFGLLLWMDRRKMAPGHLFLMFLALYSVARFLLDMVREYDATAFPVPAIALTLNQWVSIGVFFFAVIRLARGGGAPVARAAR